MINKHKNGQDQLPLEIGGPEKVPEGKEPPAPETSMPPSEQRITARGAIRQVKPLETRVPETRTPENRLSSAKSAATVHEEKQPGIASEKKHPEQKPPDRTHTIKRYRRIIALLSFLVILLVASNINLLRRRAPVPPAPAPVIPAPPAPPARSVKGKIAIVIDDWGYEKESFKTLAGIGQPLNAAVLPNLPHSHEAARFLKANNIEIILHLPMEPMEKTRLEKDTILTSMNENTVLNIIRKDLKSLPRVKGVSNHMGSRATLDEKTISMVFRELKRLRLYFLDSYSTSRTVTEKLARKTGLRLAKRDVFLDGELKPDYIKKQFKQLKELASKKGQAIGIGHDRPVTLKVLKEEIPNLLAEGYRLVYISDLAAVSGK